MKTCQYAVQTSLHTDNGGRCKNSFQSSQNFFQLLPKNVQMRGEDNTKQTSIIPVDAQTIPHQLWGVDTRILNIGCSEA